MLIYILNVCTIQIYLRKRRQTSHTLFSKLGSPCTEYVMFTCLIWCRMIYRFMRSGIVRIKPHATAFSSIPKGLLYTLFMTLCGSQRSYEGCGEEKELLPLLGFEHQFHGYPASSLVIILSYPGCMQLINCS
jgi:hypothetical protein